jgi:glycosyltransferase involved in cell wall biosynthesis
MFASVVIPTRDRAQHLSGALESLTRQTYPRDKFEVIVVDNGSTDGTREVCTSFMNRIPQFRYLYEETAGLHAGRHRGMKTAKSDILVYADDDIEAFPMWLEGIAEAFCDEQVVLVGGKNLPKFEQEPPVWILRMWKKDHQGGRMLPYLSILDLGDEVKVISPYCVFGCNFSIRKSILLEAGGFHPDAMPPDLIRYRGDGETHVARYIIEHDYKAVYHPNASIYHIISSDRMTEKYFVRRAFSQGISDSYTEIRTKKARSFLTNYRFHLKRRLLMTLACIRRDKIKVGYFKGYSYHQEQVMNDLSLYDWVTRKSYLE